MPASFFFNSACDDPVFTLSAGTPLFPPPPIDRASANQFVLTSATGGSAFGQIDSFSVVRAASPVPGLTPIGLRLAVAALTGFRALRTRAKRPRTSD